MDSFGTFMNENFPGHKSRGKTKQKDVFVAKQQEEDKVRSLEDSLNDLDMMSSGQISVNKKAIPSGNLPNDKSDAADLLQPQPTLQEEPRELHVALDGDYQLVEKKDGHYMAQLKRLINGNENLREETAEDDDRLFFNDTEFTVDTIKGLTTETQLESIKSKMDEIISTCRKYRFTHLWPWTQRGKERKADVIQVQEEAEKRRQAAVTRLRELSRWNSEKIRGREKTTFEKATSGFRRVLNYGKTFLWGMTVRNVINTAAMGVALPFWVLGSLGKTAASVFKDGFKAQGAFTLPHPHLPSTWYTHYALKSEHSIIKNEIEKLEKEQKKYAPRTEKYQELGWEIAHLKDSYVHYPDSVDKRWHNFFSGSYIIDSFGYTADDTDYVDYNNMQQI